MAETRSHPAQDPTQPLFTLRAVDNQIVAIDCPSEYSRSKPSFLVADGGTAIATGTPAGSGRWTLETDNLLVHGQEQPPLVRIYRKPDTQGDPVCEIRNLSPDGASIVIDRGFALYGVGANNQDRELDRRGKCYRVHHRETGQGNNHMPWVLSAQGFGLFFDCTFPMTIDLRDRFTVEGKNIRTFYFINGPSPVEALRRFVALTGLPPMHPAWALGYEQSTRSWMGWGELDFVTTYFREKHIPCDGFDLLTTYDGRGGVGRGARGFHAGYLDYYQGWHVRGTYREYNPKLLPNGAHDIKKLCDRGYHLIVHGYWAGDYSDPEATEQVWQDHKFLMEDGWAGWWLDGTEDASVPRTDSIPKYNLPPGRIENKPPEFFDEYDNIWALLRAKAFYEKQRRDFTDRRVYILNRTAFPSMQKYAAGVNQGDFWSSWELMRIQTIWLLNMGMSGVMFPESDIGGHYATEELTDELFIRWAFLGTFGPLMRSHGHNWRCRLPWGFGPENEARFTPLIRLRSSMFPYNYTLLREANQTGTPMMRAMILQYPDDMETRGIWDQFMWGAHVLVAPVYQKRARERAVYLPEGTWVHYWTLASFQGRQRVTVDAPLGKDPFFLKAGTVTPMRKPSDTIPTEGDEELTLMALPTSSGSSFTLYDDDRQTYRYEQGEFSQQTFTISPIDESGRWTLDIGAVEGQHEGIKRERAYRIEIPASLFSLRNVVVGGQQITQGTAGSSTESVWQSLSDRFVVQLSKRAGPVRIEFFS